MANPFTAFPFVATGTATAITQPDRSAVISDVRDFGATGAGFPTDDWAAIQAAINNNSVTLTTSASNQTAGFTASIASSSVFTGTISGNNLTTSGVTGTLAIGQTISGAGVTACQIVSGSGTSWVVNGSTQAVGPVAMSTNTVLIVVSSGFAGTIGTSSSNLVVGSGVNASFILSQFSGSAGSFGTYVLDRPQNLASQAMASVTPVLQFSSVPLGRSPYFGAAIAAGMQTVGLTNPAPLAASTVESATSNTITLNFTLGVVNSGDVIQFNKSERGTIFFPAGNYYVSAPIDFSGNNISFSLQGVLGLSVITGNFADYVLRRAAVAGQVGSSNVHTIENLTVINTNAAGGGIRLGDCVGSSIRNCKVTANQGINLAGDDLDSQQTSFETTIENCHVDPGSNPTGSQGLLVSCDGLTVNCTITGFERGMLVWGAQGGANIYGCRFELCDKGFYPGFQPGGQNDGGFSIVVEGCYFLNCGRALAFDRPGSGRYAGIRIESTNATVFGSTPQSGISGADIGGTLFEGIYITGQFSNAGVDLSSLSTSTTDYSIYRGITVNNTGSGANWKPPTTAGVAVLESCSASFTYTMVELPTLISACTATWSTGTATITVASVNLSPYVSQPTITLTINVQGMMPSGYNGVFTGSLATASNTLTYTVSNPSGSGTGGNIIINPVAIGTPNAQEGNCFNVSDANTATWGANPLGGGSTHAKVRWQGDPTNWTVVGI